MTAGWSRRAEERRSRTVKPRDGVTRVSAGAFKIKRTRRNSADLTVAIYQNKTDSSPVPDSTGLTSLSVSVISHQNQSLDTLVFRLQLLRSDTKHNQSLQMFSKILSRYIYLILLRLFIQMRFQPL